MNLKDLYIDFFISKGHRQIPSAPVVPENDPSVLFNTSTASLWKKIGRLSKMY